MIIFIESFGDIMRKPKINYEFRHKMLVIYKKDIRDFSLLNRSTIPMIFPDRITEIRE